MSRYATIAQLALPAGASVNCCQVAPSYQNASWIEPSAPTHHTSIEFGIRDRAAMRPPDPAAGMCGASVVRIVRWQTAQYGLPSARIRHVN